MGHTSIFNKVRNTARDRLKNQKFEGIEFGKVLSEALIEDLAEEIAKVVTTHDADWRDEDNPNEYLSYEEKKRLMKTAEVFDRLEGRPGSLAFILLDPDMCDQWRSDVMAIAMQSVDQVRRLENAQA